MELKKENQLLTLRLFLSSEWVLGVVTIQSLKKLQKIRWKVENIIFAYMIFKMPAENLQECTVELNTE